jgi:hypothetical protein
MYRRPTYQRTHCATNFNSRSRILPRTGNAYKLISCFPQESIFPSLRDGEITCQPTRSFASPFEPSFDPADAAVSPISRSSFWRLGSTSPRDASYQFLQVSRTRHRTKRARSFSAFPLLTPSVSNMPPYHNTHIIRIMLLEVTLASWHFVARKL